MKTNNLYFCQWRIAGDEYHKQFETTDLKQVIKKIEQDFYGSKVESIFTYETGAIELYFDFVSVFITTGMEKLIDCEVL